MINRIYATILRRLGRNRDELAEIRTFVMSGKWRQLEEKGQELLLRHPPPYELLELVAYRLQQGARLEETATIATQAIKLFPESWIFQFLAGVALKGVGRASDACQYLRVAVTLNPTDKQTLRQLTEAIAISEGIEVAAAEYSTHCQTIGCQVALVVAPIKSVRDWAESTNLTLLEVGEVEKVPFKYPNVWGEQTVKEVVFALSNKPYVAEIREARIFGNSSIILTSDGVALNDNAGNPDFGHIVSFAYEALVLAQQPGKVLLNVGEFKRREIEEGILLSGLASNAFGHWLPEFLPKLQFLEQHPDFAELPIIVDSGMPQSHFDHLRRLVKNPLILLGVNESFLCRRLLVAPSPTFFPVETFPHSIPMHELPGLSLNAMRFLRGRDACKMSGFRNRRIFLARKNMKWRRLLNEEEIVDGLSKLGFEAVYIEEMTVSEQIDLFKHAQWIVAPNGSALLNLIFADISTKVLILTQQNLHNWGTFQGPMDALGYQTLYVCGDHALAEDQKHSDYHIPLSRIQAALLSLGINNVTN